MSNRHMGNRNVIITGAAGGLGSALSIGFAQSGFNTVLVDNNLKMLESTWDLITGKGLPEPLLHPLDLATAGPDQFDQMILALESELGSLNGLIHCAAKFDGLKPLEQIPPPEWLSQLQVNLNAAWLLSAKCLPTLRKSSSSFLYFLLEDSRKMKKGYWGAYGVSKFALKALVHQLAAECISSNVQVLGINPGPMASRLRAEAYHAEDPGSRPSRDVAAAQILELALGEKKTKKIMVKLNKGKKTT